MSFERIPIVDSLLLRAWMDFAWLCASVSRLLLLLVAVELVTMPITQYLWTWDHFLRGGHDFEMTLLIIMSCLCLILLCAQNCRQTLNQTLSIGTSLLWILHHYSSDRGDTSHPLTVASISLSASPTALRSLPLLI